MKFWLYSPPYSMREEISYIYYILVVDSAYAILILRNREIVIQ